LRLLNKINQNQNKKSKSTHRKEPKPESNPSKPLIEEEKSFNTMTLEQRYKEAKKKAKIKNIELSEDIDTKFAELPKRLRTRITKKQLHYIMNNTTMSDIITHLIDNNKVGIRKLPPQRTYHYNKKQYLLDLANNMNTAQADRYKLTEMERRQKKNKMLTYISKGK